MTVGWPGAPQHLAKHASPPPLSHHHPLSPARFTDSLKAAARGAARVPYVQELVVKLRAEAVNLYQPRKVHLIVSLADCGALGLKLGGGHKNVRVTCDTDALKQVRAWPGAFWC